MKQKIRSYWNKYIKSYRRLNINGCIRIAMATRIQVTCFSSYKNSSEKSHKDHANSESYYEKKSCNMICKDI